MDKVVKNTIYNTIGSFVYLFSQWLMSILVVRLSGSYEEAGVFGTALAVSNISGMISTFSIRNYQVADIKDRFSNSEYVTFRIITCAISLLILPLYLIIMNYSLYTLLSVMCYMFIKTVEALTDVIHGIFQKSWRLDIACRSYIARGLASLIIFSLSEWLFKNLVISLLLSAVVSLILALVLDVRLCKQMFGIKIDFKSKKLYNLFYSCFPMFLHGLLSTLIYNIPRITAQKICGEEMFGIYSSVAAPAVIVQLLVCNVFSPCITTMSEQYINRDKALFKTIVAIQGIIIILLVVAILGFMAFGEFFMKITFGEGILEYIDLLIPAVVGAASIATTAFVSSIFTSIGHNVIMVLLEGATFLIDLILSVTLIEKFNLQGINYALIISCVFFIVVGYCMAILNILKCFHGVAFKQPRK